MASATGFADRIAQSQPRWLCPAVTIKQRIGMFHLESYEALGAAIVVNTPTQDLK